MARRHARKKYFRIKLTSDQFHSILNNFEHFGEPLHINDLSAVKSFAWNAETFITVSKFHNQSEGCFSISCKTREYAEAIVTKCLERKNDQDFLKSLAN